MAAPKFYWLLDAGGKIDSLYDKGKDAEPEQSITAVGKHDARVAHPCGRTTASEPVLIHDHLGPTDDKALPRGLQSTRSSNGARTPCSASSTSIAC